MANSDNDIESKQGISQSNKFNKLVVYNIGWIAVAIGVSFWFIESAVHAFLFKKGTFAQQLTAPATDEIWMRLLTAFLLIMFGLYIQWMLKKFDENKSEQLLLLPINFNRYIAWAIIIWTLLVGVSLARDFWQQKNSAHQAAKLTAMTTFKKDLVYRRWASSHGGVYVPVSEKMLPNPYLSHIAERDIITTSGRKLTLINPAYMTRQVHDLGKEQYGVRGHITSLNPLRAENSPDDWEREALQAFESGEQEVSGIVEMEGEHYMRLMRPLFTEKSCMKCHAMQGYKVGDIRGGISVSSPLKSYLAIADASINSVVLGYSLLWLIGMTGIGYGGKKLEQQFAMRKEAEEKLKTQSYYLEKAQEIGSIGTWELDIEKNELVWTDETYRIFGIPIGTPLTYELFLDCVHPDDREYVDGEWTAALGGKPYDIEHCLIVDGEVKWVREKAEVEFDEHGNAIRGTGFTQDISKRKQAEGELRKAKDFLDNTINAQIDTFFVFNPTTGKAIRWNEAFSRISGYSDDEISVMKAPESYYDEAGLNKAEEGLKELAVTGSVMVELDLITKDGKRVPFEYSVSFIEISDGESVAISISRDITERKRTETEVRNQKVFLEQVIESLSHPFYVIDANDFTIKLANSASRSEELTEETTCYAISHKKEQPCDGPEHICPVKEVKRTKKAVVVKHLHYDKEGMARIVEVHAHPVFDQDGNVVQIIEYCLDITERKQAEDGFDASG